MSVPYKIEDNRENWNLENTGTNRSLFTNGKNFKSKSQDEPDGFQKKKKFCFWQSPLKSETKTASTAFSEELKSCINPEANSNSCVTKVQAIKESTSIEITDHSNLSETNFDENGEVLDFQNCAAKQIVNRSFHNFEDTDQDAKSVSSIDTLPTEMVVDECEKFIFDEGCDFENSALFRLKRAEVDMVKGDSSDVNNEVKQEVPLENGETSVIVTEKLEKVFNEDYQEKLGTSVGLTEERVLISQNYKDANSEQRQLQMVNESAPKLLANCSQKNYSGNIFDNDNHSTTLLGTSVSGFSKYSDVQVISENVDNQQNYSNIHIRSEASNDDKFDLLTFTNSQLARLDETDAVYNSFSNKSNNLWFKKRKEQKEILRKVIKEIDILNNSIIGTINELKKQFSNNYSK